ncbi:Uu.00g015920.m01.CDS01 [Anthostomella pinea]|uniref:Uu.00g015920.m01.CDS01 n=1 Tax=Anthostomella pinea TaxID=933095 RepID=A0AAI8YQE9_9PEZI|nr:Uu.00g015920.m01.CDS01 [Anthostomella pinea]
MAGTRILGALALIANAPLIKAQPVVSILNGSYESLHLPAFQQDLFLGIPYAQDTGGANRFRIPQALEETWNGTRDAKIYGHACPDQNVPADSVYGMSEDCLSINIVRPAGLDDDDVRLPAMLWINGGSYQVGTSGLSNYNLTYLVEKSVEIGKPIVGASINYRKGGWGNMYSVEIQGSGNTNLALRDMRKGLAWTQENIENFGGLGQLLMSYGGRTDGLFHRSIQESGSAATAWYNGTDWYQPIYDKIVGQVNCTAAADTLECLRTVEYDVLHPFLNTFVVAGPGFYPTVDGNIIPDYPTELLHSGRFAHVPHLYGTNFDESTDNAPVGVINTNEDLRNFLLHDTGFNFPNAARFADKGRQYVRHYAEHALTYNYRFNTRPWENSTTTATSSPTSNSSDTDPDPEDQLAPAYKGVEHFSEVAFVFNNPTTAGPWPQYEALSAQMSSQWTHFAYGGDPNGEGLPDWPVYSSSASGWNLVLQAEAQGGAYAEEDVYRLAGREYLTRWARRRHV